jgi:hypothetical protein
MIIIRVPRWSLSKDEEYSGVFGLWKKRSRVMH